MKALVFGRSGQLARALQQSSVIDCISLGREEADLTLPALCARKVLETDADAVINAAAYTAVDKAEAEEELATLVNATAPAAMAEAAAKRGLPFVHVSTDYVFDGSGNTPHARNEAVSPINAYGRSKVLGEQHITALSGHSSIVRTSWVFSAHGKNFVTTMLRLGAQRDELRVVADQVGGPTAATDLARAVITVAKAMKDGRSGGIHHFAGAPDVSWADFAREIFRQAGLNTSVKDIPSEDYPTPARRPLNSRLDCSGMLQCFGLDRPDWRVSLSQVLRELDAI